MLRSWKNKIHKWKRKEKEIEERMNIRSWAPGYWDARYFKFAFIIIGILLTIIIFTDGLIVRQYFYDCPAERSRSCYNPLYSCSAQGNDSLFFCDVPNYEEICSQGLCNNEYLEPGQHLGKKPSFLADHFSMIMFLLLVAAGSLNHWGYYRRTGNTKYKLPGYLDICPHDWKYTMFFWKKRRICKRCLKREEIKP